MLCMPVAPIIIDRNYLVTSSICRWWILYQEGDRILYKMPHLGMDLKSYSNLIENAKEEYPLLAPFRNIYVLMPLKIKGNRVEMETSSIYGDDVYPETYLSLLVYLAVEIVRNGLYIYDSVLNKFKNYYDEIKGKIPENYVIYLDGHKTDTGLQSSLSIWDEVCKPTTPMDSGFDCRNCPFVAYCPIINGGHRTLNMNRTFIPHLYSIVERDNINKIMVTLTSLNMDYLLMLNLLMFAGNMNSGALPNIGIFLENYEDPFNVEFFYLRNGKIYPIYSSVINMIYHTGLRIYDGGKDVTYNILARELAVGYFTFLKSCEKLDKYLERKGYGEYEKRLIYLSFLNLKHQDIDPHEWIPISGVHSLKSLDTNPLFVASIVYDSKPYRDGLIDVNPKDESIGPKPKLIRIFKEKCEGEVR